MKKINPKVTIIIPVYNGEKYVKEAINSALDQTHTNIEIIVVNDGSTDNTENICLAFGNKINYILKENGGVSSALNLGISKMTGDYFSWLSHDDIYMPNKIQTQINYLLTNKDKKIITYCDYQLMNSNGKDYLKPTILNHEELTNKPEYALLRGAINGITLLIPKEAFAKCGTFDESLKCTQDYDMWLRMQNEGYKFVHLETIITKTRVHSKQDTQKNPLVITEGQALWVKLIESVSDKRKKELESSIYNYYYEMAKYLITTPYKESFEYCINKCMEINSKKYNTLPIIIKKSKFLTKWNYYMKNQGFIETLKIIIERVLNRK